MGNDLHELGQEELCGRCDGKSMVWADTSTDPPRFSRSCPCTSNQELTPEELELAKKTWELRKQSLAGMSACGGWPAAGD